MNTKNLNVAIVGAGISGSFLAFLLASQGHSTISLFEKKPPADDSNKLGKVCGGCLHYKGVEILERHGLGELVQPGTPLRKVILSSPEKTTTFSLRHGKQISRRYLDNALRVAAQEKGAKIFYEQVKIVDPELGELRISGRSEKFDLIVDCSGIGGMPYPYNAEEKVKHPGFGLQGYLTTSNRTHPSLEEIRPGDVKFLIDDAGYHGVIRTDEPEVTFHIASYLRGRSLHTSPFLKEFFSLEELHEKSATPSLYRKRAPSHGRVFLCGDALGYPEPFTGEGMRFALQTADTFASLLTKKINDEEFAYSAIIMPWACEVKKLQRRQWRRCKAATWFLQSGIRRRIAFPILPWLAPLASRIW